MFDLFSWSHILILLTVALVVVGPKDLPRLMNMAGKWVGKARNMANEFKKSFDDMARQSELDQLRAEIEKLKADDPLAAATTDLNAATSDLNHEIQRTLNPIDTDDTGVLPETPAEPPPRSGEYQVSETSAPPAKPETAAP
jgi:sec-independent protein translocase protein TatB